MDVQEVELWRVREPERPLREGMASEGIEELAASIREHGLLNPITVRDRGGFYETVAGHRRLLACRFLGVERVRVVVVVADGDLSVVLGAHENLVRRDMSIREEARLVGALMGREGWGVAGAARALNRSEGWIRDRLDVLRWPDFVVAGICEGRLSMGAAKALMGIEDEQARDRLVQHAISSGVSVEVARRWRALENLGEGTVSQRGNLVGVEAPGALSGGSIPCFMCDQRASYGELTYVWAHLECVIAMEDALRGPDDGGPAGAPPGGGVGSSPASVPGA